MAGTGAGEEPDQVDDKVGLEGGPVIVHRTGDGRTVVRDSADPNGPALVFSTEEWSAFVAGVHNGEFDLARDNGQDPSSTHLADTETGPEGDPS
jgi:hypothetical protein